MALVVIQFAFFQTGDDTQKWTRRALGPPHFLFCDGVLHEPNANYDKRRHITLHRISNPAEKGAGVIAADTGLMKSSNITAWSPVVEGGESVNSWAMVNCGQGRNSDVNRSTQQDYQKKLAHPHHRNAVS